MPQALKVSLVNGSTRLVHHPKVPKEKSKRVGRGGDNIIRRIERERERWRKIGDERRWIGGEL